MNTNNILKLINKSPVLKYGLVIIIAILWFVFVWDNLQTRIEKISQNIQQTEKNIKKNEKTIQELKDVESKLKEIQNKKNQQNSLFISDGEPTVVASQLQDIILKKATENKLQVITYRVSNQKKWKNYIVVSTYFNFRANLENIVTFLYAIESDPRLYRIHLVDILPVKGSDEHIRFSIELDALTMKGDKK